MIVTGEHIFNNTKLDEISKFTKNAEREDNEKYGSNEKRKIDVMCFDEFIDMMTKKEKC